MYHNPNLPDPFHTCLNGFRPNRGPMPGQTREVRPIKSPNCNEPPICKEKPICEEQPVCEKRPVCNEAPIQENTIQDPKSRECCENNCNNWCVNESCNTSSNCNKNQLPLLLLILFFSRVF